MKKLIIVSLMTVITMILLVSCETEYDGPDPVNQSVTIGFYQTTDTISNQTTRVSWYANDPDGYNLRFKYLVTSDLTLDNNTCLTAQLSDDEQWLETDVQFADVSFPFIGDSYFHVTDLDTMIINLDSLGIPIDTVFIDTTIFVERLDSKFFLYALDENNDSTSVVSKRFTRENRKPDSPMLKSTKLDVQDIEENHFIIDDPILILEAPTSNWSEVDFRWQGRDPDGQDVDLEFRWELYAEIILTDTTSRDTLLEASNGWSGSYLTASFSSTIKYYADNADSLKNNYKFVVRVRDDALEESAEPTIVEFLGFVPVFKKSILVIDDTDDGEFNPEKRRGNPDGLVVDAKYESLLNSAGYQENLPNDDQFDYDVWHVAEGQGLPLLVDLTNYRLIILHSEDRKNAGGINFVNYASEMSQYLDVGGKLFSIGNSILIEGELASNNYAIPAKKEVYVDYLTDDFFYKYLGLFSYTEGEHYQRNTGWDKPGYQNYDFIGADPFDHTLDTLYSMRLDTAIVNDYWNYQKWGEITVIDTTVVPFDTLTVDTLKQDCRLRDNGSGPSYSVSHETSRIIVITVIKDTIINFFIFLSPFFLKIMLIIIAINCKLK